eukprot:m.694275 g.694275  ORF g.694275 m.694275 type:complete len:989 (+) comp22879_c0_seq1:253-3219(+)
MGSGVSKGEHDVVAAGGGMQASGGNSPGRAGVHGNGTTGRKPHSKANKKGSYNTPANSKKDEKDFHATCRAVFNEADKNGNGVLDHGEFWLVLESPKLNLNLSQPEIAEIRRLAEVDGPLPEISYESFVPMFKSLLQKVYEQNDTDYNDWCRMREPKTGNHYYLNKRTGQIQRHRPENFHEQRVEEQSFEYITLPDGTELCTTVTAKGVRMYMDWDTLEWNVLPDEWLQKTGVKGKRDFQRGGTQVDLHASMNGNVNGAQSAGDAQPDAGERGAAPDSGQGGGAGAGAATEEAVDPRVGEYWHPKYGLTHTYMFENTRNTRIYYDERVNNWARMPLAWERNVTEVKAMLDELDAILPRWKNVNEQMLTLRECNYDLQDAIIFAEINWGYRPYEKEGTSKLERQLTKTGLVLGGNEEEEEDLGVLSKAASAKIYHLQKQLAQANKRVIHLEQEKVERDSKKLRTLKRENTKLDATVEREERRAQDAEMALEEMQRKFQALSVRYQDSERELLACRADAAKLVTLQNQLDALKADGDAAVALKQKGEELERMRTENTHLKMKVQQLKTQLEDPTKNPAAMQQFHAMLGRVRAIAQENKALGAAMEQLVDVHGSQLEQAARVGRNLEGHNKAKMEDITAKYRSEVMHRKQLYNKLQELKGNIRVFVRVRADDAGPAVTQFPTDTELIVPDLRGQSVMMDFDHVYSVDSKQEQIFENVKPVILSCVDGYNVCLMAYGQTNSGKTFTMTGPESNPGVNRRAIRELLKLCKEDSKLKTSFKVSVVEVYNEQIYDLLSNKRTPLKIKTGVQGVYLDNIETREINEEEEVQLLLADSDHNRSVAATKMNTNSSRSHLILTIYVETFNTISNVISRGRLTLVDLAGSERVARSEASGERLVEAAAINKSLSALGNVFQAIAQRAPHIPYRNSKLTHLLQDSLGGDSKTCLFVNCSPLKSNLSETHSSLEFGQRIRKIELGPAKRHVNAKGPPRPPGL